VYGLEEDVLNTAETVMEAYGDQFTGTDFEGDVAGTGITPPQPQPGSVTAA
jgi:hypothetical protein